MSEQATLIRGTSSEITSLLAKVTQGNKEAEERLYAIVYRELHRLARSYMRGERPGHTLQTTALVNEAYVRLMGASSAGWKNRGHFLGTAAHVMRWVLVDHARSRNSKKRSGTLQKISLENALVYRDDQAWEVLAVHEALNKLAEWDQRQSRIVELRFFGGLDTGETARVLGISATTVKREFQLAKAWLYGELSKTPS
ncbi:MAG: sigma-70 family RNA polymerase sigma factor [Acidobacteriia bacterium]|nr:sigma-70 family RNA polymerase sigma factor [Terriglobia bacterium]